MNKYIKMKRTKVAEVKSKGFGDTIEKFTRATGIKKVVDTVVEATGSKGCGCGKRKDTLNEIFPYEK